MSFEPGGRGWLTLLRALFSISSPLVQAVLNHDIFSEFDVKRFGPGLVNNNTIFGRCGNGCKAKPPMDLVGIGLGP